MRIIKFLSILFVAVLLCACGVIKCTAFPDNLLGWIPYKTNNILLFASGSDSISFNVKESSKTEESSIPSNCDCLCSDPLARFSTDSCLLGITIHASCDVASTSLQYSFSSKNYNDKFIYNYSQNTNVDTISYNLDGIEISHVITIEKDSAKMLRKIFLHKGMGLIGFIDKNNKEYKFVIK